MASAGPDLAPASTRSITSFDPAQLAISWPQLAPHTGFLCPGAIRAIPLREAGLERPGAARWRSAACVGGLAGGRCMLNKPTVSRPTACAHAVTNGITVRSRVGRTGEDVKDDQCILSVTTQRLTLLVFMYEACTNTSMHPRPRLCNVARKRSPCKSKAGIHVQVVLCCRDTDHGRVIPVCIQASHVRQHGMLLVYLLNLGPLHRRTVVLICDHVGQSQYLHSTRSPTLAAIVDATCTFCVLDPRFSRIAAQIRRERQNRRRPVRSTDVIVRQGSRLHTSIYDRPVQIIVAASVSIISHVAATETADAERELEAEHGRPPHAQHRQG